MNNHQQDFIKVIYFLNKKNKTTMSIYHDISDYIQAKENYRNTPGKIIDGVGYYIVDGNLVSEEEYRANNSKPRYEPPMLENPDGQNISKGVKIKSSRR
jgi:hypothetical protein